MAESEHPSSTASKFELLVQSVTDYAILYARPARTRDELERRRASVQGLRGRRDHRPALLPLLHARGARSSRSRRIALETAEREGRFENEGWRVRKDGSRFWANVVIDPIRDPTGQLVGFAKVTRDLTDRRAAEARASRERGAVPAAGPERHRLRHLHARPRGASEQLECRRRALQGLFARTRSWASTSRASTPRRTEKPAIPRHRSRDCAKRRALRS